MRMPSTKLSVVCAQAESEDKHKARPFYSRCGHTTSPHNLCTYPRTHVVCVCVCVCVCVFAPFTFLLGGVRGTRPVCEPHTQKQKKKNGSVDP
jgi:hypothetical protein